jgi:hypothetical protein
MTAPAALSRAAKINRVLAAAAIYFAIVFAAGLALGPVRVLWVEPWIGATLAVLCEAPLLIFAMVLAARVAPVWARLNGGWFSHLAVGLISLALQQAADVAVGFGLRGMTLGDQIAYFRTPPGAIYGFTLVVFTVTPLIAFLRRPRSARGSSAARSPQ